MGKLQRRGGYLIWQLTKKHEPEGVRYELRNDKIHKVL